MRTQPAGPVAILACMAALSVLCGCGERQRPPVLVTPAPYHVLPVDEAMSCSGIADSFGFSARRAARLQDWLEYGPIASFGSDRFREDTPEALQDERARLDALSDLQRTKGCAVADPVAAVAYERGKYSPLPPRLVAPIEPLPPPLSQTPPPTRGPVLIMRG